MNEDTVVVVQIAADNAVFGQTGPKVGSFDAGYGSSQMVRLIGSLPPPHVCVILYPLSRDMES